MSKEVATTDWKEALAKQVAVAAAQTPETTGIQHISLAHGRMTINEVALPGDEVQGIILASTIERTWFDRPYNPDDAGPPECFALGSKASELMPHENVKVAPSNTCKACPMAEFGTARQGKGPACKTKLRLCIMPMPNEPTANMIGADDAEMAILKVSPTSVVNFNGLGGAGKPPGYFVALAKGVDPITKKPDPLVPWAVISKVMIRPHNKKMHEITVDLVKPLEGDALSAAAYGKSLLAEEAILTPYTYDDEDGVEPAAPDVGDSLDGARY